MGNPQPNGIATALLDALTLEWSDNGNIMAEAVRDSCILALSKALGKSFEEVSAMVDKRIQELQ